MRKKRRRSEAAKQKTIATFSRRAKMLRDAEKYETFFKVAYAGLVVRGYDHATEIQDLILREIWRTGRMLMNRDKRKSLTGQGGQ